MAGWHLDTKMAQDIVARTMRIIDTNINVICLLYTSPSPRD